MRIGGSRRKSEGQIMLWRYNAVLQGLVLCGVVVVVVVVVDALAVIREGTARQIQADEKWGHVVR